MDTQDFRSAHGGGNDSSRRASLQLELRVPERQMLATFRDAFLRWLSDRSGPFARAVGASDSLSLDEVPASDDPNGMSTLRLTVSWPLSASPALHQGGASATVSNPPPARRAAVDQFVFFPDPPDAPQPLYHQLSVPIHADAFQPPAGLPQLRVSRPIGVLMANNIADALDAVRAFAVAWSRRLGISGLTIRVPLAVRPGGWAVSLVGATAVTAGFVAGSNLSLDDGSDGRGGRHPGELRSGRPGGSRARAARRSLGRADGYSRSQPVCHGSNPRFPRATGARGIPRRRSR